VAEALDLFDPIISDFLLLLSCQSRLTGAIVANVDNEAPQRTDVLILQPVPTPNRSITSQGRSLPEFRACACMG